MRRRFLREAEVAGRLDHATSSALDRHRRRGRASLLVMELVGRRRSRAAARRRGRHPPQEVVRDRAPSRTRSRTPTRAASSTATSSRRTYCSARERQAGRLRSGAGRDPAPASPGRACCWGSPEYMAPELFARGRADPRTDVFSLGVLLHEWSPGACPGRTAAAPDADRGRGGGARPPCAGPGTAPGPAGRGACCPHRRTIAGVGGARWSRSSRVGARRAAGAPHAPARRWGRRAPQDVPRCFACGHEDAVIRHTTAGGWEVSSRKVRGCRHHGRTPRRARRADRRPNDRSSSSCWAEGSCSQGEQEQAISAPALLFSDLDETDGESDRDRLTTARLKTLAERRQALGPRTLSTPSRASCWLECQRCFRCRRQSRGRRPLRWADGVFGLVAGGAVALAGRRLGRRATKARAARCFCCGTIAPSPPSPTTCWAPLTASAELAAPEVRALFVEASRELYRLTRRAAQLAQLRPAGSSEGALAQRVLDAGAGRGRADRGAGAPAADAGRAPWRRRRGGRRAFGDGAGTRASPPPIPASARPGSGARRPRSGTGSPVGRRGRARAPGRRSVPSLALVPRSVRRAADDHDRRRARPGRDRGCDARAPRRGWPTDPPRRFRDI